MSDEQDDAPKTSPDLCWAAAKPRPIQFRLASALVFTALSALVFGLGKVVGIDPAIAAFSVAFLAVAALVAGLIRLSSSETAIVQETDSVVAAETLANFLRHHGIPAAVVVVDLGLWARVTVPLEQEKEANRLLKENQSVSPDSETETGDEDAKC